MKVSTFQNPLDPMNMLNLKKKMEKHAFDSSQLPSPAR